ncbi:MAG: hypothetical protein Q9174_006673, partial [Haloplaca sp. 1 TL-2023]
VGFEYDEECSSTGVQPYLTAFCGQWGVDIGAAERARPSSTTTVGDAGAGGSQATPGSTPSSLSSPTSPPSSNSSSSSSLSNDKITIIATIAGAVAGIIAAVLAFLMYRHMKRQKVENAHHWYWPWGGHAHSGDAQGQGQVHEMQGSSPSAVNEGRNNGMYEYGAPMHEQGLRYK